MTDTAMSTDTAGTRNSANAPHPPAMALDALLTSISAALPSPSAMQALALERVAGLRRRLNTECFQVAALGQFKRGKSTLLNALLGIPVLPTGVIPVTAVATFLARTHETPGFER
jgi:ribosome biogenesis GTPase A